MAAGEQTERNADRLAAEAYDELRAMAAARMGAEGAGHTLQPTALGHEAYLRLAPQRAGWQDKDHFCAVAAGMLRRALVDHARARRADKRGGGARPVTLIESAAGWSGGREIDVLGLDESLAQLAALHERQARIVELKFFAGMTIEQIAAALDVSTTTVENDWAAARAWLRRALSEHR